MAPTFTDDALREDGTLPAVRSFLAEEISFFKESFFEVARRFLFEPPRRFFLDPSGTTRVISGSVRPVAAR